MPAQNMEQGRSPENAAAAGFFYGRGAVKPAINRLPLSPEEILSRQKRDIDGQSILKDFEGKFAMAGNMLELTGANLNRRTAKVARLLAGSGMLDSATLLELRLILPETSLSSGVAARGLARMTKLRHALADEHGITRVIPNSHPILAGKDADSLSDPGSVWDGVSHGLDGLARNWRLGLSEKPDLAMFAIVPAEYAGRISDGQSGLSSSHLTGGIAVLDHVGARPEENMLVPARPNGPGQ